MNWVQKLKTWYKSRQVKKARQNILGMVTHALPCKGCGEKPYLTDYGDSGTGKDSYHMQCQNKDCKEPRHTSFREGRGYDATMLEWNQANAKTIEDFVQSTGSRDNFRNRRVATPQGMRDSASRGQPDGSRDRIKNGG